MLDSVDAGFPVFFGLVVDSLHVGVRQLPGMPREAVICLVYHNERHRAQALSVARALDSAGLAPRVEVLRYKDGQIGTTDGVPYVTVLFDLRPIPMSLLDDLGLPPEVATIVRGHNDAHLVMTAEADFQGGVRSDFYEEFRRSAYCCIEIVEPYAEDEDRQQLLCRALWSKRVTSIFDCAQSN